MSLDLDLCERPAVDARRSSPRADPPKYPRKPAIPRADPVSASTLEYPVAPMPSGLGTVQTVIGATSLILFKLLLLGMFIHSL